MQRGRRVTYMHRGIRKRKAVGRGLDADSDYEKPQAVIR